MKKNYFVKTLLSLLMLVALPAKAQVSSMVDLYGKYTFTADMEVTAEGESLKDNFSDNCEVIITKDANGIYDAAITGIAGGVNGKHFVSSIDTDNNTFKIPNWNGSNSSLWSGGIWMSNAEGIYPFGWGDLPLLGDLYFTYDPATKNITLPDFTLVTVDNAASTAIVVARFKNAKLTLVESETIQVMDLSGDWHFKAGEGTYDVMEGSELPTEFDMVIKKTTDDNKNYTIDLTYHTYPTVQLKGTFDGVALTVPLDSTVLDADNGIYLRRPYGTAYSNIEFSVVSEKVLSLGSYLGIAQYVAEPAEGESFYNYLQYFVGTAKKTEAEGDKFDWAGTFKVVAGSVIDADPSDDLPNPSEFDMVVEYYEPTDAYYIVNFWGNDVRGLNYGGISLKVNPENSKEAEIATGGFVASIIPGELYCKLYDGMGETGTIPVTVNEDGTISIGDFFIKKENFNTGESLPGVFYQEVTATKAPAVELTWDGTYTVTADVTMQGEGECPETFEMVVDYFADYDMFLVTKFLGNDVTSANYGGISFTIDENTATIKTNSFVKTVEPGVLYYKMFDANGGSNPLEVTRAADGSLTIADFTVYTMSYDESWNAVLSEQPIATYTNVKAVKNPSAIESVKKEMAKITVKGGVISIEGGAQPVAVYNITGRQVFSGVASQVPVAKGLHIVKVGNKAVKVNVK